MRFLITCAIIALGFAACKNGMNLETTDLKAKGLPFSLMTPKDATIKVNEMAGGIKDATIQKDRYDMQIMGGIATMQTTKDYIISKKGELEGTETDFKVLNETEDGILYEMKKDGKEAYDFYVVKIIGDQEFVFNSGFTALPTKDEAQAMYDAALSVK